MKKILATILAILMLGSVIGCTASDEPGTPSTDAAETAAPVATEEVEKSDAGPSSETLLVAADGEPSSLFPAYQQDKVCNRVNSSMFNYLVEWDDVNKTSKPSIATEWEWIDDTHIRFTIRDDVYFTNGEKLIAEDVAKSLEFSCEYHATYTAMFDPANFVVEDDTHVVLALTEPYGNLIDILGCDYYTIFDWSAFDEGGQDISTWIRNPVGSGPYKLQEWVDGDHITLVRNEEYWGQENLPYYQYITYYFISDQAARVSALLAGTVDVAFNVATNQIEELKSAGFTVNPYEQNVTQPLTFNMISVPALADENVRKAIMYCIDKSALAEAYHYGYGSNSNSPLVGVSSSFYSDCETFSQDLEVAQAAMDAAIAENGWTAEDLTFTTWAVSGSDTSQIELLQYYLSTIGITLHIEQADLSVVLFDHLFVGDTTIGLAENDTWDVTRMLNLYDSRIATSYNAYSGEYEDELHALIDAAKAADDESRYDAYAAVQQFLADHYVTTVIGNILMTDAWRSDITGMKYDAHCWPNVWDFAPVA